MIIAGAAGYYENLRKVRVLFPCDQKAEVMSETYKLQKSKSATEPQAPSVPRAAPPTTSKGIPGGRAAAAPKRLVSLDAYRGLVMTLLAASGFGLGRLSSISDDHWIWDRFDRNMIDQVQFHFSHPAWESISGYMTVSLWDMIQPSFMFMVGVAMPFSYARRTALGSSRVRRGIHAFVRAVILVLLGVFLHSIGKDHTNWVFPNVLAQIGLGYFFVYLLLGQGPKVQIACLVFILVGYWGLFKLSPPPEEYEYAAVNASLEEGEVYEGKFAPWSKNANVAHFFDVWLLNQLRSPEPVSESDEDVVADNDETAAANEDSGVTEPATIEKLPYHSWWFGNPDPFVCNRGGYQTLNFVPSIATMLLGVLCGQMLVGGTLGNRVIFRLLIWGAVCLALGILAHHTVCPIVKRIWTPSWVLFSGGYAMWTLAVCYFLFDFLPLRKLAFPLVVVGMNSIAMYLMGQLLRPFVQNEIIKVHFSGVLKSAFGPDAVSSSGIGVIVLPTATFIVFWLVAYWMYRNRYFVRI